MAPDGVFSAEDLPPTMAAVAGDPHVDEKQQIDAPSYSIYVDEKLWTVTPAATSLRCASLLQRWATRSHDKYVSFTSLFDRRACPMTRPRAMPSRST
jgi:hypothetical protein